MALKSLLRKIVPESIILNYHYCQSKFANLYFQNPSEKMIVIGVTGTKGKTTTANFIWSALESSGEKCGLIGTANIRIGKKEYLNKYHMTMPGTFVIQGLMKEMVKAKCKYLVMEVTSEGVKQWRHLGINFDFGVFTNLTPEHLRSHENSFENYKKAKGEFFNYLTKSKQKFFDNQTIKKTTIVNLDSPHSQYFLDFPVDTKITYGLNTDSQVKPTNIENKKDGIAFKINNDNFEINLIGEFNILNALPAIAISQNLGIDMKKVQEGFNSLKVIPGRMEKIDLGQNFEVFVDYAHEKESMTVAVNTAKERVKSSHGKVVVLLGAEGGGRDKNKRAHMGEIVGKLADYIVVSNVDPYDDDPTEIVEDIAKISEKFGKVRDKNLFVIEDRQEGIKKALSLAQENDLVLITGKGSEQSMIIGPNKLKWDDREVVKEELKKII